MSDNKFSECEHCGKEIDQTKKYCDDDCETCHAETSYENYCSDFYGGSNPVTIKEKCRENERV